MLSPGCEARWRPRAGGRALQIGASLGPQATDAAAPRAPGARLVLDTGDSMMLHLHEAMVQRLAGERGVTVRADTHPSTGISKPRLLNWPRLSLAQAKRFRPSATVVFIGANDGFPLATPAGKRVRCCRPVWRREYARRAGRMMRAYVRSGEGRVYWVQLPQARDRRLSRIYGAVNAAVRRAAKAVPGAVRVVHLDHVLTPQGRYRDSIVYEGRRVRVREGDGIHLTPEGASIAAAMVVEGMRLDGVLDPIEP